MSSSIDCLKENEQVECSNQWQEIDDGHNNSCAIYFFFSNSLPRALVPINSKNTVYKPSYKILCRACANNLVIAAMVTTDLLADVQQ